MTLRVSDTAPDFIADTTDGTIHFHQWIANQWTVLFSHPKHFSPFVSGQIELLAGLERDFAKRGARLIGVSYDPVEVDRQWLLDIKAKTGLDLGYPLVSDFNLQVAKLYDMLPPERGSSCFDDQSRSDCRRRVYLIGPDKRIKMIDWVPLMDGFQERQFIQ